MIYHYHGRILTNGTQEYIEDVNITKDPPKDTFYWKYRGKKWKWESSFL